MINAKTKTCKTPNTNNRNIKKFATLWTYSVAFWSDPQRSADSNFGRGKLINFNNFILFSISATADVFMFAYGHFKYIVCTLTFGKFYCFLEVVYTQELNNIIIEMPKLINASLFVFVWK